ncbi:MULTISPECIES: maleylpyruvate isomerase family mycothiol-dependent enzyme [Frankia]|uniref:maleylpyruvate isomerase family mycothiol-dependent enzyme n=1 Tax=Frankia TaxID=1854 RepID=UPI0005A5505B|nr:MULTISPECIES: maleylpyruvate isomerase family mycothiol-dependent enzyme [Frankia]
MAAPSSSRPAGVGVPPADDAAAADPEFGPVLGGVGPDPGPAQESGIEPSASSGAWSAGPDYRPSVVPHDRLAGCAAAHRRLLDLVERVDDEVLRRPSGLPGWTVAHLLTHLARNAEGHSGMVEAAAGGDVRDQYPGGQEQRDGDIAAGRDLPATTVRAEVAAAVARLERAWDAVHVDVWRTGFGRVSTYGVTTLADLVFLRWRETEIHLVDLALTDLGGPSWADLSPAYVEVEWAWAVRGLPARLPPEVTVLLAPGDRPSTAVGRGDTLVVVDAPTTAALAWLTGREPGRPEWPALGPWW